MTFAGNPQLVDGLVLVQEADSKPREKQRGGLVNILTDSCSIPVQQLGNTGVYWLAPTMNN